MITNTVNEVEQMKQFIRDKLAEGISCARKTVRNESVELVYYPESVNQVVRHGQKHQWFTLLEDACKYYDSIYWGGSMNKDKVLHLTLKKKWFDMTLSGEKKEEYRQCKDYWMKRLAGVEGCGTSYNFTILSNLGNKGIDYDYIIFTNGYGKERPSFKIECKGIFVGIGKKKWGAPDYKVFILKLGNILTEEVW